jgi:hypothetical protein
MDEPLQKKIFHEALNPFHYPEIDPTCIKVGEIFNKNALRILDLTMQEILLCQHDYQYQQKIR